MVPAGRSTGIVTLVAVGMVAFGLGRMRLTRTLGRVSLSSQALYGSFTLLGVGLYLLGVGLVGEALRLSGRTLSVGAAELAVFVVTTPSWPWHRRGRSGPASVTSSRETSCDRATTTGRSGSRPRTPSAPRSRRTRSSTACSTCWPAPSAPVTSRSGCGTRRTSSSTRCAPRTSSSRRRRSTPTTPGWPPSRRATHRWISRGCRPTVVPTRSSRPPRPSWGCRFAARGSCAPSSSSARRRAADGTTPTTEICSVPSPTTRGSSSPTPGSRTSARRRRRSTP